MKKYFGTDGIRGIANGSLSAQLAAGVGKAAAVYLVDKGHRRPTVLLARDSRESGACLSAALFTGLASMGADVIDCGVLPTPAAAFLTEYYAAQMGIVLSASHNPPEYNGIKVFDEFGRKLSDEEEELLEGLLEENIKPTGCRFGKQYSFSDAFIPYCEHIIKAADCDLAGLRVALDTCYGAQYFCAPYVFKALHAEVVPFFDRPDGRLINVNCGATHPEVLGGLMAGTEAEIGFAFDGDGDRVMACEGGAVFDGDKLLYANAAAHQAETGDCKGVVGTVMTNFGTEKALRGLGIELVRTDVGDKYVAETMRRRQLPLGGEQSGHLIFRRFSETGDGLLTAVRTARLRKNSGHSLAVLCSSIADFPQKMYTIQLDGADFDPGADAYLLSVIGDVRAALGGSGYTVVRKSGTEPVLRIMVQGEDADNVEGAAETIAAAVRARIAPGRKQP